MTGNKPRRRHYGVPIHRTEPGSRSGPADSEFQRTGAQGNRRGCSANLTTCRKAPEEGGGRAIDVVGFWVKASRKVKGVDD
jgi:hypothetical protein